jgi:hypothetical protein
MPRIGRAPNTACGFAAPARVTIAARKGP